MSRLPAWPVVALVALLAVPAPPAQALGTATGIAGAAAAGGWQPVVVALQGPAGPAGYGQACFFACGVGTVAQIVPPSGAITHWCVATVRVGTAGFLMIYIRDLGDGITTFDQFTFVSALANCSAFPVPGGFWFTAGLGQDFRALAS